jgi:tetratricopeptide (TPR) repeat protein
MVVRFLPLLLICFVCTSHVSAQVGHSSNDFSLVPTPSEESVDGLLAEAQGLFMEKRPLDARAKLQQALQIAPEDFRPNFYLGVYYLTEVGHFKMADRYLTKAEELFRQSYGSELDGTLRAEGWKQNAKLLQYITETKLNLDNYQEALKYADRFGNTYWDEWFPGTRAWILMKLRRIDEAIQEAQSGVLRGADETRTYNILGILYSLKGDRKTALESFKRAINAELRQIGSNQAATPLNNSGEVYHELFQDDLAEASWLRALQLPDGCDHILPSLNTALLYIEQLRLFQSERALSDFEACFAQKSLRSDTEHRALIALARGKIALHQGDSKKALKLFLQASDREQFYGKIGTDPEDLEFAASISLSQVYLAEAERLRDQPGSTFSISNLRHLADIEWLKLKSWWQLRNARQIAISKLNNFEDIYVRNTDSMLEYPTLGAFFNGVSTSEIKSRIDAVQKTDVRKEATSFYELYLLEHEVSDGANAQTIQKLERLLLAIRPGDPLLRAEALSLIVKSYEQQIGVISGLSPEGKIKLKAYKEELFNLLPSQLRISGSSLPVSFTTSAESGSSKLVREIKDQLNRVRFQESDTNSRYQVQIEVPDTQIQISLVDTKSNQLLVRVTRPSKEQDELISEFLDKVFGYRVDAGSNALPKLELMDE